jgi:hypothetical protein
MRIKGNCGTFESIIKAENSRLAKEIKKDEEIKHGRVGSAFDSRI